MEPLKNRNSRDLAAHECDKNGTVASLMRLFKIVHKLVRTYHIFNMADRLMNIQLQKGPALYDHSLPAADDRLHIGSRMSSPEILFSPCFNTMIPSKFYFRLRQLF